MKHLSKHYMEARDILKRRALYVINLLAEIELPEQLEDYRYIGYCGVEIDNLDISVTEHYITLTYANPYENIDEIWTIETAWVDMGDEDVIREYQSILASKVEKARERQLNELIRKAEQYGYVLHKNTLSDKENIND